MKTFIDILKDDAINKFGVNRTNDIEGLPIKVYCSDALYEFVQEAIRHMLKDSFLLYADRVETEKHNFTKVKIPFVAEFEFVKVSTLTGYFLMLKEDIKNAS